MRHISAWLKRKSPCFMLYHSNLEGSCPSAGHPGQADTQLSVLALIPTQAGTCFLDVEDQTVSPESVWILHIQKEIWASGWGVSLGEEVGGGRWLAYSLLTFPHCSVLPPSHKGGIWETHMSGLRISISFFMHVFSQKAMWQMLRYSFFLLA